PLRPWIAREEVQWCRRPSRVPRVASAKPLMSGGLRAQYPQHSGHLLWVRNRTILGVRRQSHPGRPGEIRQYPVLYRIIRSAQRMDVSARRLAATSPVLRLWVCPGGHDRAHDAEVLLDLPRPTVVVDVGVLAVGGDGREPEVGTAGLVQPGERGDVLTGV